MVIVEGLLEGYGLLLLCDAKLFVRIPKESLRTGDLIQAWNNIESTQYQQNTFVVPKYT